MQDIKSFKEKLQSLIAKFEKDKRHYLSKGYLEAQLRIDFLNPSEFEIKLAPHNVPVPFLPLARQNKYTCPIFLLLFKDF